MAILEPTKKANTLSMMHDIRQGPAKPRPTMETAPSEKRTDLLGQMKQIVGENLWQGDYDPMRGIAGMTEDYNAALTGYRQTPEGLEQEPGSLRALTLLSPGFGGAPPGTAASGILGRGVGKLFKPFYSEVEEVVKTIPQNKATASQWYQTIKKTPGVKEDELEWMGLREWLNDKKTVTKEELQDFINANKVEIKEIVKGREGLTRDEAVLKYNELSQKLYEKYGPGIRNKATPEEIAELDRLNNIAEHGPSMKPPKWEQPDLVLPGEYSNYREFLFQLPGETYQVHAYDEPGIVAWVRFNERNINGKNTLFLEEIQSDWAQAGRKHGFKSEKLVNQAKERFNKAQESLINDFDLVPDRFNSRVLYDQQGNKLDITDKDAVFMEGPFKDALDEYRSAWEETMRLTSSNAVPDMPFKKTDQWASLVMKRMIRYAVENDIDQIAWTTGRQQVNRYSEALRQNVDWIKWEKTEDGIHLIGGKGLPERKVKELPDGTFVLVDDSGNRINEDFYLTRAGAQADATRFPYEEMANTKIKENELSDVIGKSMAKQIIENPNQTGKISGTNIKIDDVGMAGFYDRILPNLKFIKKMKGKVRAANLPIEPGSLEANRAQALRELGEPSDVQGETVHIMQITPKMKETAVKGMPMFSITPIPMPSYGENE